MTIGDASPLHVQTEILTLPFDIYALGNKRLGIGGNTNRGLSAATGDYILQLQDDWECVGPPDYLKDALAILQARADIGMVICCRHPAELAGTHCFRIGAGNVRVFPNNPAAKISKVGQHAYTDWPHLKRRAFHKDLGFYREDLEMWETELDFSRRVNAQTTHYIADMNINAFRHIGADLSFNTGNWKARVGRIVEKIPGGTRLMAAVQRLRRPHYGA